MKRCIYRQETHVVLHSDQWLGSNLSHAKELPKCRVLVEKGVVDQECHNEDCSEASCNISPLNTKKGS